MPWGLLWLRGRSLEARPGSRGRLHQLLRLLVRGERSRSLQRKRQGLLCLLARCERPRFLQRKRQWLME
jgi:hypothetical protein